jgi:rare lipoprotein A
VTLRRSDRKLNVLALGMVLAASLTLAPWAIATPESDGAAIPLELTGTQAVEDPQVLEEVAEQTPPSVSPARWEFKGNGTQVFLDGKLLFTFTGDDGVLAARAVHRLSTLKRQGALRSDRVTPARQGEKFAVRVGSTTVIEIDEAFARKQGARASALTFSYVNALRGHLGGMPIQVQASRGLLPGARIGIGNASWYGNFFHGRRAASGERFDMHAHTAAHKTLPFGTLLLVTNLANGKSTLVRVTDRGPYAHGRTLDVSRAAAEALGMIRSGVARVQYSILK